MATAGLELLRNIATWQAIIGADRIIHRVLEYWTGQVEGQEITRQNLVPSKRVAAGIKRQPGV